MSSALVPQREREATDVVAQTTGAAAAAREKAAIEARYLVSMHRPRQWDDVRLRLLDACKRPGFAATAMYAKPVAGTKVVGMSIRFVEEALRCARNVDVSAPVVAEDATVRVLRVSVTDLESNVTYSEDVTIEKTVERRKSEGREVLGERANTRGDTVYIVAATEDELLVKQNNQKSKAIRNCGLRILPGDIVEEARAQIAATAQDEDAKDPRGATKRLTDAAWTFGIGAVDIESYLGCKLDQMTSAQRQLMREVLAAIRDGETSWAAVVEQQKGQSTAPTRGMAALAEKLAPKPEPEPTPPAPAVEAEEVEAEVVEESAPVTTDESPWDLGAPSEKEQARQRVAALLESEGIPEDVVRDYKPRYEKLVMAEGMADTEDYLGMERLITAAIGNKSRRRAAS